MLDVIYIKRIEEEELKLADTLMELKEV